MRNGFVPNFAAATVTGYQNNGFAFTGYFNFKGVYLSVCMKDDKADDKETDKLFHIVCCLFLCIGCRCGRIIT